MGNITTYDPWDDPPSRNSHSRPFCQQRIQAYFAARPPGGEWDIRDLKSMEEKPLVEYLLSGISTVMCSRIELKVSKTKHKQLQQAGGTFAMQLACAAGFLSDAKRINHKTGFI